MYRHSVRAAILALVLLLTGFSAPGLAQELFFAYQSPGLNGNTVAAFPRAASGAVAATRSINGAATGLNSPDGISADTVNGEIAIANGNGNSITVYAIGASGNATPLRTIAGPSTALSRPLGVAIDTVNNEIFVMNNQSSAITVYPRTANGDVAPLRTISGANTVFWFCCNPYALALDTVNNEILVPLNMGGPSAAGYAVFSRTANGNVAPLRTVQGLLTTFASAQGIAVDTVNNEIAVTDSAPGVFRVLTFSRGASGNVAPLRILTNADNMGVRIDPVNNELLVASGSGVKVYARTASGATAPLRTLTNSAGGSTWDVELSMAAAAPPPAAPVTAIPALGAWSLLAICVLLGGLATRTLPRRDRTG